MTLAVVTPTLNEEADLLRTLTSVKFADEILVVDSGSTDQTVSIAKKFGARVISHPFISYSDQRNFADTQVKSDWILSIDADVVVPSVLATEIRQAINSPGPVAYFIGRENEIWGKVIRYTDWGPKDDSHIRLYRRGSGSWQAAVHEQFVTLGPTDRLKNNLFHYNYRTVSEFIAKTDHYSGLAAQEKKKVFWLTPGYDFFKRYFYKLGFLDGYRGLFLSYLQAVYYFNLKVKLWQKGYT